jgi:thiamine-phosphate pyrophosphorylase
MAQIISSLHYITQDNLALSHVEQVKLALEGGVKWVQFRSKNLSETDIRAASLLIKALCKAYQATFILNDNWELAIDLSLDGVHVGLSDTPIAEIRKYSDFIIGGTANSFDDIQLHFSSGADYVGVGPFRRTKTKKNLSPVLGLEGFTEIVSSCNEEKINIPIIAIGGIQLTDIQLIKSLGVQGVAIASQINEAKSPKASAFEFIHELTK